MAQVESTTYERGKEMDWRVEEGRGARIKYGYENEKCSLMRGSGGRYTWDESGGVPRLEEEQ